MLAGTPLRHVAETLGIAESLLGKWKRQYEQQGDDAFPGNGKQRGESAEPGGEGVEFAIPPLDKSPFLAGGPEIAASILLRGIDGPIRVGDETFDGHMPSFASALDDAEIARLATYLQVRFTGRKQAISGDGVAALRREFADAGPFAGGQAIAARFDSSLSPAL